MRDGFQVRSLETLSLASLQLQEIAVNIEIKQPYLYGVYGAVPSIRPRPATW